MKRKIAQGTAALLFAAGALVAMVVILQLMARSSGPDSTEGEAISDLTADDLMGGDGDWCGALTQAKRRAGIARATSTPTTTLLSYKCLCCPAHVTV